MAPGEEKGKDLAMKQVPHVSILLLLQLALASSLWAQG